MKKSLILCAVLVLSGCAATVTKIVAPSGKTGYSLNCGTNLDSCYEKAGELCPNGYTMFNQSAGTVGVPVQGGMLFAPQHRMAIECR